MISFKDVEMGRVSWTVQVDPIKSHKALKGEEEGRKGDQSDVTVEEEETWSMRGTLSIIIVFEDGEAHEPRNDEL